MSLFCALSEQCTSQSVANSSVRITSNCVPLYMIAANSALRRALRTVRFAKLLIDFPFQFWCSFEPLHLHIQLLYRMALWQVAEDLAEEVDTSALIGTGPPFTAKGLYWRLDTHSVESFDFPVLVFHLNQAVVCKLFFQLEQTATCCGVWWTCPTRFC